MLTTEATEIDLLRTRVDQVDEEIAKLIIQRRRLSQSLQGLRLRTGESRVDISRERHIVRTYTLILGAEGAAFAHDVLNYCKQEVVF